MANVAQLKIFLDKLNDAHDEFNDLSWKLDQLDDAKVISDLLRAIQNKMAHMGSTAPPEITIEVEEGALESIPPFQEVLMEELSVNLLDELIEEELA